MRQLIEVRSAAPSAGCVLMLNSQFHRNSSLLSLWSWIIYFGPWFRGDICSHRPRESNGRSMNPSSEPGKVKWYWSHCANALYIVRIKPLGSGRTFSDQVRTHYKILIMLFTSSHGEITSGEKDRLRIRWRMDRVYEFIHVHGQSAVRKTRAQGRGLLWRGRTEVHNSTTLCIHRLLRGSLRLSGHLGKPDLRIQPVEMNRGVVRGRDWPNGLDSSCREKLRNKMHPTLWTARL